MIAVLDDPVRRRLYDYVAGQADGVSRAEAAEAVGIQRTLAAFHLDRLAEAGLVEVTFRRPAGRSGPGAGRPAKLYRRSAAEHQVSVPPRDYRSAAELLAEVVDVTGAEPELQRSARSRGAAAGRAARRQAPHAPDADLVVGALSAQGYQPYQEEAGLRLRNCPFHDAADVAPAVVCGLNVDLVAGVVDGVGASSVCAAALDGVAPDCCVTVSARTSRNTTVARRKGAGDVAG